MPRSLWQYQSHAEPLDTSAGFVYDPAVLDWSPEAPDFARRRPPVLQSYYPFFVFPTANPPDTPFAPLVSRPPLGQVVRPALREGESEGSRDPQWESRLRRFTQKVSLILNSLVAQGYVVESAPGVWKVVGGALSAPRAPTATDDSTTPGVYLGVTWVDSSASPRAAYVCVDTTEGAAVWRVIT